MISIPLILNIMGFMKGRLFNTFVSEEKLFIWLLKEGVGAVK